MLPSVAGGPASDFTRGGTFWPQSTDKDSLPTDSGHSIALLKGNLTVPIATVRFPHPARSLDGIPRPTYKYHCNSFDMFHSVLDGFVPIISLL